MNNILVEIAPGELIDKITILEIKLECITDEMKLKNVKREHAILTEVFDREISKTADLQALIERLRETNRKIWDIEDTIRDLERTRTFDDRFIAVARSVYRTNDLRAATKLEINKLLESEIVEEKSYSAY